MFRITGNSISKLAPLLALIVLAATAAGTEVYVYPAHETYSTGRIMHSNGSYSKHNHEVMYGKDVPDSKWQGYFRFDLSWLPDSLTVESAVLEYRAITVSNPPPHSYITHVTVDPLTADGATMWSAITTGAVVAPDMAHGKGWIERPLDAAGLAAVQAGLAADYVALGVYKWDSSDTRGHIKGFPSGPHSPRLRLAMAARDIGIVRIVEPQGVYDVTDTITPTAVIENHGEVDAPFRATFIISTGTVELYRRHVDVPSLPVGTQMSFFFPDWTPDKAGVDRVARVEVEMAGDFDADNNRLATWFSIARVQVDPPEPPGPPEPPNNEAAWGWKEMTPMPMMASSRPVKLGGWLAVDRSTGTVYAGKGNNTGDFASYDAITGRWRTLASIPAGARGVTPGKGARGTSDGAGSVYMVKGNKSTEFWRYDIAGDRWKQLPDLPLGPNSGAVRSGTGLVFVEQWGTGYLYLLKGPKGDLVRYNTASRQWDMLASAPLGNYKKWDRGSWLVHDGAGKLYAHKAKKHELWTFDLESEAWDVQAGPAMPLVGSHARSLKLREGGSATWHDGALYALKGGKSQEYWRFEPETGNWSELETIPRYGSTLKTVRMGQGGDMASYPFGGALYALKGSKSLEFWRYTFAPEGYGPEGGQASPAAAVRPALSVSPSIARGATLVRLSGIRPGVPARVSLYDPSGRAVQSTAVNRQATLRLDLSGLTAGVYLVRLESGNSAVSQKLVISR